MTNTIDNSQDIIDSRDIIERIDELEGLIEGEGCEETCEEYKAELEALKALADECEGYGDWEYGETLIRRSYFTEYVMELLSDIGDLPRDIPWYIAIDEEATAKNVEIDYMSVDFDGVEYLMRSC